MPHFSVDYVVFTSTKIQNPSPKQGAAMMNDGGVYNFAEIWSGFQVNVAATSSYGLSLDPMVMDQRSNHSSPNHNSRKRRDEDECAKGGASTNNNNNAMESEGDNKRMKAVGSNVNRESKAEGEGNSGKAAEAPAKPAEPPKKDYIHVRARRGEATDSHSLAERVSSASVNLTTETTIVCVVVSEAKVAPS